jgi:chemotaxis protein methyltransferase CheR
VLRRDLVPGLVDRGRREFRAWSAGCASGEEPYTLAMLVTEHLEQAGRADALERTRIEATDVDRACLERARAGVYRREMLSELPPELMSAYFQPAGSDLRVVDRVRRLVALTELDLSRQRPLRRDYHLILCRNVVIYFDRTTQERLFQVFTEALAPGGYLFLGKVETLLGPARERLQLVDPRERIYRRPA